MDELRYLKSALRKLSRRKKRQGYYEGADILKATEIKSLFWMGFIIIAPFFVGCLIMILNNI